MAIVEIENIRKNFGELKVLKDISLTVEESDVIAVIGSSGSGKSTLLRCINNLETVDSGNIAIDGDYIAKDGVEISDKEIRRICTKTSMVFQHFNLFGHLTCLENVTIAPTKILGRDKKLVESDGYKLLEQVGLSDKATSYPFQLSGGQKQRVAIARAMAMNPKILLLDEPTSALDPETIGSVTKVIYKLAKSNVTMVIVTHDLKFARVAATKIIYMDEGEIVETGTPEEIFDNPKSDRLKKFLFSDM